MQVSWIRHRDIHLLTSGRMTYTSDQRFISVHNPHTEDWILKVRLNNASYILACLFHTLKAIEQL